MELVLAPLKQQAGSAHPLDFICVLSPAGSVKEEARSASPHCPKPDESEEPLGTAMETEAAKGQSQRSPHCEAQGGFKGADQCLINELSWNVTANERWSSLKRDEAVFNGERKT